jgi:hypothetical protein
VVFAQLQGDVDDGRFDVGPQAFSVDPLSVGEVLQGHAPHQLQGPPLTGFVAGGEVLEALPVGGDRVGHPPAWSVADLAVDVGAGFGDPVP